MWIVTKEAIIGVTRTAMGYIWAWLLTVLAGWSWLMELTIFGWPAGDAILGWINGVDPVAFALVGGTIIYGAIRWLAEKWPWVGRFLVFNVKPEYPGSVPVEPLAE